MYEEGIVARAERGGVVVKLVPGEHCSACPQSGGCHANADLGLSRERSLTVTDPLGVHAGDRVELYIPEQERLRAGLAVFGLPIGLAVAGAIAGSLFGGNLATGIGLGAGLVLGIGAAFLLDRNVERQPGLRPRIVRVLAGAAGTGQCH